MFYILESSTGGEVVDVKWVGAEWSMLSSHQGHCDVLRQDSLPSEYLLIQGGLDARVYMYML